MCPELRTFGTLRSQGPGGRPRDRRARRIRSGRTTSDDSVMSADVSDRPPGPVELLHPFYLDTDMSMAFAAALAGGVALEREEVGRDEHESQAVRNLRGNLRLFGVLGAGGGRESKTSDAAATESRLVRHHTEASIFIALHDELRRTGRIAEGTDLATLQPGHIVSLGIGPAVAPLRRVVDQIVRLLDVAAPLVGADGSDQDGPDSAGATRQQRRQQAREAAKQAMTDADEDGAELRKIRSLFVALQDDLDRSGMVDVVVHREDAPSVVLTLDKRFASDQALEMLHTARFTVIGKVTQVWRTEEDFVNLYRRSVMSLVPALAQTVSWGMFTLLATLAATVNAAEAEEVARAAAGMEEAEKPTEQAEIMLGDDVQALTPAVNGPAIQVLPLAICA